MRKINTLTYNGIVSSSLGVFISGSGTFDAAEQDVTPYEIPGKNGDLLISNNRYKNIEIIYPAFVPGNFSARAQGIRNWLRSAENYAELSDSYDTTHFREALVSGRQSFEPVLGNKGANFQLVFNCKPQRFLVSGQTNYVVGASREMENPTQFNALPLFYFSSVTSGGTLTVSNSLGTFTLTATANRAYSGYIDCANQNIYYNALNLNSLFSGTFPIFAPGTNTITVSDISGVTVRPRWWEL